MEISEPIDEDRRHPLGRLIRAWALFGGGILVVLVLLTTASTVSNWALGLPVPGDFELVRHGVAIAAFAFLPYAQLTGANVTVDLFTRGMGVRAKAAMGLLSSLIALIVSLVLFRQMWLGMIDYFTFPVGMVTIPIPLWTAFPPILVSLALLAAAACITGSDAWITWRRSSSSEPPGRHR